MKQLQSTFLSIGMLLFTALKFPDMVLSSGNWHHPRTTPKHCLGRAAASSLGQGRASQCRKVSLAVQIWGIFCQLVSVLKNSCGCVSCVVKYRQNVQQALGMC